MKHDPLPILTYAGLALAVVSFIAALALVIVHLRYMRGAATLHARRTAAIVSVIANLAAGVALWAQGWTAGALNIVLALFPVFVGLGGSNGRPAREPEAGSRGSRP